MLYTNKYIFYRQIFILILVKKLFLTKNKYQMILLRLKEF